MQKLKYFDKHWKPNEAKQAKKRIEKIVRTLSYGVPAELTIKQYSKRWEEIQKGTTNLPVAVDSRQYAIGMPVLSTSPMRQYSSKSLALVLSKRVRRYGE
jgi:hypothetical protein